MYVHVHVVRGTWMPCTRTCICTLPPWSLQTGTVVVGSFNAVTHFMRVATCRSDFTSLIHAGMWQIGQLVWFSESECSMQFLQKKKYKLHMYVYLYRYTAHHLHRNYIVNLQGCQTVQKQCKRGDDVMHNMHVSCTETLQGLVMCKSY